MPARESIAQYYQHYYEQGRPEGGEISAYRIEEYAPAGSFPLLRRDFYKIKLLCNTQGVISYAGKTVAVQAPALIFANPLIPHAWERQSGQPTGYACLFTEGFMAQQLKVASVADSPLFRVGGSPVVFPTPEVVGRLSSLFELLLAEMQSSYIHKYDLMRTYIQTIIHESLKLVPAAQSYQPGTSAAWLSASFLELLDRQFPIASPQHTLPLRNANEFARQLAVHTNHLNKALRGVTGQTTTAHIAAKIVAEAQALLQHSDWSLAEIGYCLGFEHASNFNLFFKKHTGQSPSRYRRQPRVFS
jgi:AraC family transcriptional activator of pobA